VVREVFTEKINLKPGTSESELAGRKSNVILGLVSKGQRRAQPTSETCMV